jgi:hypothetical protein
MLARLEGRRGRYREAPVLKAGRAPVIFVGRWAIANAALFAFGVLQRQRGGALRRRSKGEGASDRQASAAYRRGLGTYRTGSNSQPKIALNTRPWLASVSPSPTPALTSRCSIDQTSSTSKICCCCSLQGKMAVTGPSVA